MRVHRGTGGSATINSIGGTILRSPGQGMHNLPWSWHLDPQNLAVDPACISEAWAVPSVAEANLSYFVDTLKGQLQDSR